jgi:sugar/nucleoside kinase (ribokinase family)
MSNTFQYDHVIATGGIGTGIFFEMLGNDTLGREESRMAKLLPYRDYCKQHIILHYISVLLGSGENNFQSYAIGKVGKDEAGVSLISYMQSVGIDTTNVHIEEGASTLFSVCYQYPDHAGGNITTAESASSLVTAHDIDQFFEHFDKIGRELILSLPEVPVQARIRLLEHGRKRNCLNIASITSSEVQQFEELNGFELTDMLFINQHEAAAIAGMMDSPSAESIVLKAIRTVIKFNADITVFVTCGASGVYCYQKRHLEFFTAHKVQVVSTAGAGDAFLAGTVAGICLGLPLFKYKDQKTITAIDVGMSLAAASVTSPHTINPDIDKGFLTKLLT